MRDKYVKNYNFFIIPKNVGDSNVWKEIDNHIKYVGAGLEMVEKLAFGHIIGLIWCLWFLLWMMIIYNTLIWRLKRTNL